MEGVAEDKARCSTTARKEEASSPKLPEWFICGGTAGRGAPEVDEDVLDVQEPTGSNKGAKGLTATGVTWTSHPRLPGEAAFQHQQMSLERWDTTTGR